MVNVKCLSFKCFFMFVIDCWSKFRSAVIFVKFMVKFFIFVNVVLCEVLVFFNLFVFVFECVFEVIFFFFNFLFSKSSLVFISYIRDFVAVN